MNDQISEAWARLPDYLAGHVGVSMAALALGLAISLPLALAAVNRPVMRSMLLTLAGVVQTIPGIALLALFYPLLLMLSALTEATFGKGFSALGFLPALLALALYAMLPIARNTITGLQGVAAAAKEAAVGVGMTRWQALRMVELPLAMPIIMAGIRTAAVWVIGTATLATPVGQTSLGNYIFTGLQTQNWIFVLFGCVAAAVLALAVDQLLALVERGFRSRSRAPIAVGLLGLAAIAIGALAPAAIQPRADYVIGAKPFAEQYILASLIEQRLAEAGATTAQRPGLGSTIAFNALAANEIDAYVEYTGTLWANQMGRTDVKPRAEILKDVTTWLRRNHGIAVAGSPGFDNAYALAMKRERAEALGIRSVDDLARHARDLSIAGDYEFFGRPEWQALRDGYGLAFRQQREMQAEFMYPAIDSGEVDVISAYTSDGRVAKYDLLVLEEPREVVPPYDAILLVAPRRTRDETLLAALKPLNGGIDVELMREANLQASDGGAPGTIASWLWDRMNEKKPSPETR
ncbi:MAG TPA: ABC transporter permease/substrate-binding protein [Xanthobacteraceae bacterium]|nr:ABC transporter permease/substrate-binding protein [Xanthobacteraceae bacterium]